MRNDIGVDGARALAASRSLANLRYAGSFGSGIDPTEEVFTDQGVIVDTALPTEGRALEAEFGHIHWRHTEAHNRRDFPPRRY